MLLGEFCSEPAQAPPPTSFSVLGHPQGGRGWPGSEISAAGGCPHGIPCGRRRSARCPGVSSVLAASRPRGTRSPHERSAQPPGRGGEGERVGQDALRGPRGGPWAGAETKARLSAVPTRKQGARAAQQCPCRGSTCSGWTLTVGLPAPQALSALPELPGPGSHGSCTQMPDPGTRISLTTSPPCQRGAIQCTEWGRAGRE